MICDGCFVQTISSRNVHSFVRAAGKIEGSVLIVKNNRSANAKSMLSVLSLSLYKDDKVEVCVKTGQESAARQILREFVIF